MFGTKRALRSHALKVEDLVDDYLAKYSARKSYRCKKTDLEHFLTFLQESGRVNIADVTAPVVENFLDERRVVDAPSTVLRRHATLNHFLKFCERAKEAFISPMHDVVAPKKPRADFQGLDDLQVARLRGIMSRAAIDQYGLRNFAMLELFLNTGLRISELLSIREGQISDDLTIIKSVKRKASYYDDIHVNARARAALFPWVEARHIMLTFENDVYRHLGDDAKLFPLFCSTHGGKAFFPDSYLLSPETCRRVFKKHMLQAGIPKELCHPHTLRHTFAHALLAATKDIALVSQALGHRSLNTTMRYTTKGARAMRDGLEQLAGEKGDGHEE